MGFNAGRLCEKQYVTKKARILVSISVVLLVAVLMVYSRPYDIRNLLMPDVATNYGKCLSDSLAVSTCGCRGDNRGVHQNVIAYSLYGNFSDPGHSARYVTPMKIAIGRIRKAFPEWIIRIYIPLDVQDDGRNRILTELFADFDNVDLCNVTSVLETLNLKIETLFPMTWRFLPLLDPLVDRFMSRDTDGVVLDREFQAVMEWLSSPATFHVMRDHPWHCVPMLGGLWGVKIYQNRKSVIDAAVNLFNRRLPQSRLIKGADQELLNDHIWPVAHKSLMSHDSYCCGTFIHSTRPFPTRRQGTEYVGDIFISSDSSTNPFRICPHQCRPPDHPDWIYC